tara:strand:+ start:525 stop:764 length:240 start_codon:yes stop_codon:yes gene_type:complete
MIGMCTGCEENVFVVEYINNGENKGNYCVDCMTCCGCGKILSSDKLAFMQSYTVKDKQGRLSIPAKECDSCIANPEWKD